MTETQLRKHLKPFDTRRKKFKYLLEVETANTYSGIRLNDRKLAEMLSNTAQKSGVTKYIRLFFFPDHKTKKVVFKSGAI